MYVVGSMVFFLGGTIVLRDTLSKPAIFLTMGGSPQICWNVPFKNSLPQCSSKQNIMVGRGEIQKGNDTIFV